MNKYQIGKLGESIAQIYFKNKGFSLITHNYKVRGGEIDLVCRKNKLLYFIEVKTRTNFAFGFPEEALTYSKRKRMKTAIFRYLAQTKSPLKWQADLLSIELSPAFRKAKIRHFQNIEL